MTNTSDSSTQTLQSYLTSELNQTDSQHSLDALISLHLKTPSTLFTLPDHGAEDLLRTFSHRYILCAPLHLEAYDALAKLTGIDEYTQPFFKAAHQFFFDQHPAMQAISGAHTLLYKAYLFHRLMEELNDRVILERQLPLSPIDMSYTNLIVHALIGDEQANLLDQTVLIQLELINAERADKTKDIFQRKATQALTGQLQQQGWGEAYTRWPFLNEDIADILLT